MNVLQQNLYDGLMSIVESHESFFYVDQVLDSNTYRIFNYRLASYSQWVETDPYGIEARGITFLIDDNEEALALVSWPFEKFFNLNENPFTMDLNLDDPLEIQEKMDGSLISSMFVFEDDNIWLKSKGSLFSEQATAARKLLQTKEYRDLHKFVRLMVMHYDATVIMEYMAPDNRIVVAYDEPKLTVIAIRDNQTGMYMPLKAFKDDPAARFFVRDIVNEIRNTEEFVKSIPDMQSHEGYVIKLQSGQRVKIKTEWYLKLHHIKDSINSQRRLFEAVVYDTVDDIKSSFYDDPMALQIITDMEAKVEPIYNHMVDTVERFYERNKKLERKEYAIKGQQELDKMMFGLAMAKYIGREVDYRATMVKHRKEFGIKDDPQPEGD